VLLGNKADLKDAREVTAEQIRKKIEETSLPYFEVSAKSGENIKEAFHFAGNEHFNNHINSAELTISSIGMEKFKKNSITEEPH
jgi:GTPase SAR1 family protein